MNVLGQDIDHDRDGTGLASFGIVLQKEEPNERTITTCCLNVCRSIEEMHVVSAGAMVDNYRDQELSL